jgi:hypothetical protein
MWMLVLMVGCKKVEPAPEALDDLLHYMWQKYDDGIDEELANAITNLDKAVAKGELDPSDGSVSALSDSEIAIVGVTDRSASDASGVFMVNRFACKMGQLEEVLSYAQQDELYEGVYEAYQRDFASPRADWLTDDAATLSYGITYTAKVPLGGTYDSDSNGALRQVPTDFGRAVVQRSAMPEPAQFENDNNKYVDQDYQLEIYYDAGGGEVVHVYGLWRDASYGSGLSMSDEGFQRIVLNNMYDWDKNTAKLCEEGRP